MTSPIKVALVTGAATGIGRAVAVRLAARGLAVAINYSRSESDARETLESVLKLGVPGILCRANVADDAAVRAMVERCELSATEARASVEIIDLRTIVPWDRETVLASVRKTRRCLVVHEDTLLAGFGAEISATLAAEAFYELDAPIARLAVPNVPIPYEVGLMEAVLPSAAEIAAKIFELVHS